MCGNQAKYKSNGGVLGLSCFVVWWPVILVIVMVRTWESGSCVLMRTGGCNCFMVLVMKGK